MPDHLGLDDHVLAESLHRAIMILRGIRAFAGPERAHQVHLACTAISPSFRQGNSDVAYSVGPRASCEEWASMSIMGICIV